MTPIPIRAPVKWSDGLVVFAGHLWTKGRARKTARCHLSGMGIAKGDEVWRPLTNGNERMRRISALAMNRRAVEPGAE